MKIAALYSHLNGHEWLLVHEKGTWKEIEDTIKSINAGKYKTKVSDEKTMKGKLLYAPIELNRAFSERLSCSTTRRPSTARPTDFSRRGPPRPPPDPPPG